jgi:glycosyltransferase involved in cell wall biosynthesis
MRILHLTYKKIRNYSDPDAWLKQINFFGALLEQMAREVDVKDIHCIDFNEVIRRNGVEYHFLEQNIMRLWFPIALHRYVQRLRPDVIIVHGFAHPWQVLLLRMKMGRSVPIVIQHHSEKTLGHYKRFLQKHIDRFVAAYFFPSFEQARSWVDDKQIRNVAKVHEVMEVPSVFRPVDNKLARARTNVKEGKVYLWVGRFDDNKDPITLVSAFMRFANGDSSVRLYVIFRSTELLEEIKLLLNQHPNVSEQIVLVGKIQHDELLYWFNSADFIISTSHYEGMGVAVCEAMSCGCIPLLSDIPSFRKMTGNGKCGLLFKAGDISDLTATLQTSLLLDIEVEKGKTLATYKELLSAEAISSKMIAVCRQLVSSTGKFSVKAT